jgi:hypothetical protein
VLFAVPVFVRSGDLGIPNRQETVPTVGDLPEISRAAQILLALDPVIVERTVLLCL